MTDVLCYKDNSFGTLQYTDKPCDYANYLGIPENERENVVRIYPNPTTDKLFIESQTSGSVFMSDILGREVSRVEINKKTELDMSDLLPGVFLVSLLENGKIMQRAKVIKE